MAIPDDHEFVSSRLPDPPARIVEIGCGDGHLARALSASGHDVTAIDPRAPDGAIFRRVSLLDFHDSRPFDAAVACLSLHHIHDLAGAVDRIARLLPPDGLLVMTEFAKERVRGATAGWYFHQRRALAAAGGADDVPESFERWSSRLEGELAELHTFETIEAALRRRFAPIELVRTPYLHGYRLDDALEPLERKLIADGRIEATGVRYVGRRRAER